MEFSNQDLCNLLEMPTITRVLRHLNLQLEDFPNSRWSQQEVGSRIGVDTLNEKCFNHIVNSPHNGVFQFVYKYINQDFNYNCLQMIACDSCYFHCDYMENLKIFGQIGQNGQNEDYFQNRTYTYILKKYYDISQLQIELKEGCENSIKDIRINISRPCSIKNFKKIDSIHHTTILKPALQAQAIQIEFVLDNNNKLSSQGQCQCGIKKILDEQKMYCLKCHDNLYVRSIQLQCTASTELNEIQIENEDEAQVIKEIIGEQINLLHQKQSKLIECNNNLYEQYRGLRNGRNGISVDMIELYRQFNQASLLVKVYNNKLQEYYGININQEQSKCIFTDCVECSRRLIQKGTCFDDQLLRKIYFSDKMTQKEQDVAIDLLEPSIQYNPQDLDQPQSQEWMKEFTLQCHLQLKEVNVEFIKIWMNKCHNITEVLLCMLQNLLISVLNLGVSAIYQLLDMIQLESLNPQNNILSQLYLHEDTQVQTLMNELVITISKTDEILALNLLFAQFHHVKHNMFYEQFEQISIEKSNEQIIQYLIQFIKEVQNIDQIKLFNSFKLIQRCWKNVSNQLSYYIQLDEMHSVLCKSAQEYSFLNEIYNQLYSTLTDSKELLTYFVQSLLKQNQSITQIQRFTHMIHQILYKKLEFKIKAIPHRSTEQHIQKQIDYNSLDFETFDQLKQQIRKDLALELEFDLIIHDHLIDDINRSIQLVFKSFYVNFQEKRNLRILSLIRQTESEFINHKIQKDKRSLPVMIIEFSLQGIGNHDNLPYIPQFYDEQKKILETHLSQFFDFDNLHGLFNILKTLHQQGNRFTSTISKIISILKFLSNTPQIKQLIIACHGIILILKVYLKDPQPIFLEFMEDLLQENYILTLRRRFSESLDGKDLNEYNNESADNLKQVLQYLENNKNPRVMQLLCQIIPLIIRDLSEPGNVFMTHFKDRIVLSCDIENANNSPLSIFAQVMYYNPKQYTQLRMRAIESKIYDTALSQCMQDMQNSVDWLKIVLSVAKGNQRCQEQLLEIGLIEQIFEFANDTREHLKEVSKICDNFIQYIKEEIELVIPQIKQLIEELMNKKNQQFKQINQNKRQQIMKRFQKSSYEAKINQIQDEKGLFCISCKEGYSTNNSLLGIYIYCNSQQIPEEKVYFQSGGQQIQEVLGIQSVTYFTVIHLQCHKKTVDYAIKQHNKNYDEPIRSNEDFEWECATKNNVAKCNNFFPIKNLTNQNNFESGIELYMRKCEKLCKNRISSKSWLLVNDLKGLIIRIAKLDDLSIDTGAGKYEHNIKFIPLLMNAILQFDITQYSHLFQIPHMNLESLSIAFVAALFSSYKEWKQYKLNLLEQAKTSNYMVRVYYLIDLIMGKIIINVKEKQNNYKLSLDQYLCQDQQNILKLFLDVEKQYSLKARTIQIDELSLQ